MGKVRKDDVLLVRGDSGEEVKAKYDGTVSLEKNSLTLAFLKVATPKNILSHWVTNSGLVMAIGLKKASN